VLAARHPEVLDPELAEPLLHAESIEQTLLVKSYIECGIPLLELIAVARPSRGTRTRQSACPAPRADRVFVTYATRLLSADRSASAERLLLSPFDESIHFTAFRERLPSLTPYALLY